MTIEQELIKFCKEMNLLFISESTNNRYKFIYRNRPDNPHYNWGVGMRQDGMLCVAGDNFKPEDFNLLKEKVINLLKLEKLEKIQEKLKTIKKDFKK